MSVLNRLSEGFIKAQLRVRAVSEGQGFVEYLLIIGLVALGLSAALIAFRTQLGNALSTVGTGV